ncbi:MAG: metal-dependent hydrolase [Planctomycetes bacterium]|nr:metal-dependent hydrolase [Planctomycetota bacterium]
MAPGTHALIGWWTANVVPLTRRDRLLVFLGGVLPDLDGLGLLFSDEAYLTYHHVLFHNVFACLGWTVLVALATKDRLRCVVLCVLNWHLHLACDYFGSRGPWDTQPWVLPYFYPLIGRQEGGKFVGPPWYWNPWQWPLDSWPNLLVTLGGFAGWLYIAVRLNRTWFEFVSLRMDAEFCRVLQKWFGTRATATWSDREGKLIRKSYLIVTIAALFACVIAAAHSS